MNEIEIIIDNDGTVIVHVQGVKGETCTGITKALEKILGGIIEERNLTGEYFEYPDQLANGGERVLA